jgi:hypothetical protein
MRGIECAAARDEVDGPNTKLVPDEGAYEGARVSRKYVDTVIREPRDEPVCIECDGGDHPAIGVEHRDAVCV